jgi:hypothetical protein
LESKEIDSEREKEKIKVKDVKNDKKIKSVK